jgi:ABC-type glutathione transport system ATPase component
MSNHDAVVHQSPSVVGKQPSTDGGMKRSGSSIFKNGMLVSFRNISYKVRNAHKRKEMITLLDGVSGYLRGGELVALMGPSGCGESTEFNFRVYIPIYSNERPSSASEESFQSTDARSLARSLGFVVNNHLCYRKDNIDGHPCG